ncbi:MAG TPA: tRNA pseudouridine(38-40) synthase TruA [Opitutaceae bacterium]
MRRWKCVCAYDGTGFSGWQSQRAKDSVQDALEARLDAILKVPTRIHGSGRTDAGVHAEGQVFHFDADWPHGAEKLAAALRHRLSRAIQIKSVKAAGPRFHSRFDAKGKVYTYNLYLGDPDPFTRPYCWSILKPLDLRAMAASASVLVGKHDFKAFSAFNGADPGEAADTRRHLRRLDLRVRGRSVRITAEGDGFLYRMVRSLVGALVSCGEGRLAPADIKAILGSRTRTGRVQTAPPQGLFLTRVTYR